MKLRIAIFEQNKNIRNSIDQLLNADKSFELAGSFGHTNHCITDINACRPDIVIMDIDIAGTDGIEAVSRIKAEFPKLHILIQTVTEEDERLYASILAGASGYILKSRLRTTLVRSLKEISFGGAPMSPSIARRVLHLLKRKNVARPKGVVSYPLTQREREVLKCLVNGHNYKTISTGMKISYETVRSHMKKIYEKLQVASLTEVVAKAIYQNIV
ncbi:response regulator transcription factor [Mucilaginibacter sp. BJC16-A38]|uniref:LuxR C-terminal-related transcriptional regulator n=1 Tax=Mucilaginibacter phenanthrenivorans TaxID=1234842 RepID=UPI0021575E5F|nr:response regulator transcription factor [Mucilaginibacter phenanthrenivorans]MCR8557339.1 response regulator transcription factor [Mucilaginibacter phenanthrenivorans]